MVLANSSEKMKSTTISFRSTKSAFMNVFRKYNKLSTEGSKFLTCLKDEKSRINSISIYRLKNQPQLDSILTFLNYLPPNYLTSFEYIENVAEDEFFPKIHKMIIILKRTCSSLTEIHFKFSDDGKGNVDLVQKLHTTLELTNFVKRIKISMEFMEGLDVLIDYLEGVHFYMDGYFLQGKIDETLTWFKGLHPVENLEMRECNFLNDFDVIMFISKSSSKLKLIRLDHVESPLVLDALSSCISLHTLELNCSFFDVDSENLKQLSRIENLLELHLIGIDGLSSEDLIYFFTMPFLRNLIHLTLNDCKNITDEVLLGMSLNCKHLQSLAVLDDDGFNFLKITDFGLSKVFCNCPSLCTLRVSELKEVKGYFAMCITSRALNLRVLEVENCGQISPYYDSIIQKYVV